MSMWSHVRATRFLLFATLIVLSPLDLHAKNANLSNQIQNVSEMYPEEILQFKDANPEIAVSGSTIHVMWPADESNPVTRAVYYRRSKDGGKSWELRKRLFADPTINTDPIQKHMAVDGDTVHIAVAHSHTTPGWYYAATYLRSGDGGGTFDAPLVVYSVDTKDTVSNVRVVADQGKATIGLHSYCNYCIDNAYVLLNTLDGGKTFKRVTAFSTTSGRGWAVCQGRVESSGFQQSRKFRFSSEAMVG